MLSKDDRVVFLNQKHKILIISVIFVILAVVGYYVYGEYNLSNTQKYLKTSLKHKTAAANYLNQVDTYENKQDYANAAIMRQKSSDEIAYALNDDNNALIYADGIYREYIENDILLLQTTSKLIDFQLYLDRVKNNDLNPGQEKVNPSDLYPHINKLKDEVLVYNDKADEIIASNPDKFKFLNQS